MRPLLLAGTIATLVAVPHTPLLAQTNAASPVAPTVRVASNTAGAHSIVAQSSIVATTRDTLVTRPADAGMLGSPHNAVSRPIDDSTQTESIVGGIVIRAVTNGAGFVTLADGTTWQIALGDRPRVQQWLPGDHVIVQFAPIAKQPNFDYRLVNGRDRSQALVAFAGLPDTAN